MNFKPYNRVKSPRPLRRNPWPVLLAGAAVIVMAGNVACEPVSIEEGKLLGDYMPPGIEWISQQDAPRTWDDYWQQ